MSYIALNASSKLTGVVGVGVTTVPVTAGTGTQFAVGSNHSYVTFQNAAGTKETCKITGQSGDNLTVVRTKSVSWAIGDVIECRPCAEAMADYAVAAQINASSATAIADADETGFVDASDSNALKKITWANVKATLKTYFDSLYRTLTSDITLLAGKVIVFEGATDDAYETTLTALDPTADNTISLPNKSGTVALTSDIVAASISQDFRLTLSAGLPVTTADVTGVSATTIYCSPYIGNKISLYTGGAWVTRSSAEFSLALGTLTSGKVYDVFCYDNAGTPTLEFSAAWNSSTARFASGPYATALPKQDGVYVKSTDGTAIDATRRYLGTFYTVSTTQTEDSVSKRYLWNYYNRILRPLRKVEATATWTYTTDAFQQARATSTNQIETVIGVAEDLVEVQVRAFATASTAPVQVTAGIGLDSTTVNSGDSIPCICNGATGDSITSSLYSAVASAGRHYWAWLERSAAAGTTTWSGTNGVTTAGIVGKILG